MKNIINFIFALFLSISALDLVAQENTITTSLPEYTFDKPDFNYPQTVIANAYTELNTALKLHDGERIVLALIQSSLAKSMISNDSLPNIIDKIESIASIEPNKCISSVLYLLEANIINEYYSRNRYKLSNRTEITSNSSNIFEWNEAQFKTHISSLLDKAISENNALKSAKITDFSQIVKINKVSVNTPSACMKPCFTGCEVEAVAATLGAEPMPASLLKSPRLMPCITAAPIPPPTACSQPKALRKIWAMTEGISAILKMTTPNASRMYPTAMMGTSQLLTRAMRCMPPKIIMMVATVSPMPIHV